ncbi:MAG TPA: hypothetical protein VHX61_11115 [Rhizomicrobium sp.]|nr:hypothetical protein [Rhizomicrobium sp.]
MGSARTLTAYEAPLAFSVSGRAVLLRRALEIVRKSRTGNDPSCTLGADAIAALAPVRIDYGRMSMVLQ